MAALGFWDTGTPPAPPAASPPRPLLPFQILKILTGKIVVGHAIHNDFKALQYFHPKSLTRDTSHIPPLNRKANCPENATMSLKTLTKKLLNRDIQVVSPQMLPGPRLRPGRGAPCCLAADSSPRIALDGDAGGALMGRALDKGPSSFSICSRLMVPVLCLAEHPRGCLGEGTVFKCMQNPSWEKEKAHRGALRVRRVGAWASCDTFAPGGGRPAWQEGGRTLCREWLCKWGSCQTRGLSVIWNVVLQSAEQTGADRNPGVDPPESCSFAGSNSAACRGAGGEPVGKERNGLLWLHALLFLLRSGREKWTLLRGRRSGHHGTVQVG